MKPVTQEDPLGCGVACVAYILTISYQEALQLFKENKVVTRGYTCKDICAALKKGGKDYVTTYVGKKNTMTYKNLSIVYIKKSATHKHGHYLCKTNKGFMDPFVNLTQTQGDYMQAIGGFVPKLSGKVVYEIYPLQD